MSLFHFTYRRCSYSYIGYKPLITTDIDVHFITFNLSLFHFMYGRCSYDNIISPKAIITTDRSLHTHLDAYCSRHQVTKTAFISVDVRLTTPKSSDIHICWYKDQLSVTISLYICEMFIDLHDTSISLHNT